MKNILSSTIPFFEKASSEINLEFENNVLFKKIPKGQFIAMEGDNCTYLPIVKSGKVRVYKLSKNGNEMTLYRINPGESCILTISCLLTNKDFPAIAFTENDSELYLVNANVVKTWISKYEIWRDYILDYLSSIILKVLTLLENTTFNRTETRVIDFLISHSEHNNKYLKFTHQHIASEIGTSREVVSRILKELESEKLIKLSRGSIVILQKEVLKIKNLTIN
jgi:CRP/FNR family transcriptional regulator